jgi:hypothetical protein
MRMMEACTGCGVTRRKRERWFWVYPDILPPGQLVPIAQYCKACGAARAGKQPSRPDDGPRCPGIMMAGPSVRAILAGTKTQTRRLRTHAVGDRPWVKEAIVALDGDPTTAIYCADGSAARVERWPWKRTSINPMFMPRSLSRITLEITEVRQQRLHDITETDADAEGVVSWDGLLDNAEICRAAKLAGCCAEDSRAWFAALWERVNGNQAPWSSNPTVCALTFRAVR